MTLSEIIKDINHQVRTIKGNTDISGYQLNVILNEIVNFADSGGGGNGMYGNSGTVSSANISIVQDTLTFQDSGGDDLLKLDQGSSEIIIGDSLQNTTLTHYGIIKAGSGGGELNLRQGADNVFALTNDLGVYNKAWFYGDDTSAQAGFGVNNWWKADTNSSALEVSGTTWASFGKNRIQLRKDSIAATISNNNDSIQIFSSVGTVVLGGGIPVSTSVAINSRATFNAGVTESVAIGMVSGVIKTNNTAYVSQLGFSSTPLGGPYDTILETVTASAELPVKVISSAIKISSSTFVVPSAKVFVDADVLPVNERVA